MRTEITEDEEGFLEPTDVIDVTPDRITWLDVLLASLAGITVFALLELWRFNDIHPDAWPLFNTALKLRPQEGFAPGVWRAIVSLFVHTGDFRDRIFQVLHVSRLIGGLSAFIFYFLVRSALQNLVRGFMEFREWKYIIAPLASLTGALVFSFSDPVWRIWQSAGDATLMIPTTLLAFSFFLRYIAKSKREYACIAMFLAGILFGESPFALLLPVAFFLMYYATASHSSSDDFALLDFRKDPAPLWIMTLCFVVGTAVVVWINVAAFIKNGCLEVFGWTLGDVSTHYLLRHLVALIRGATIGAWIFGGVIIIVPFVIMLRTVYEALSRDSILQYFVGLLLVVCAFMCFTQLSGINEFWFWTLIKTQNMVPSHFLLSIFMAIAAFTFAMITAVFLADAFIRREIVTLLARANAEHKYDGANRSVGPIYRSVALVFLVIMTGVVVGQRRQLSVRAALSLSYDYIREVIKEADEAKRIFSDGIFDLGYEIEARLQGRHLRSLALLGGDTARDQFIRRRGLDSEMDRLAAEHGAAALLRTWQKEQPERLVECAVQMGFEIWLRSGNPVPPCSGVLCRPGTNDEDKRNAGIAATEKLATAFIDFSNAGHDKECHDVSVKRLFSGAMWRMARMARMRASSSDAVSDTSSAMKAVDLAESLDDVNESLDALKSDDNLSRRYIFRQLTPREALAIALRQADFMRARQYAEIILKSKPNDPDANFALAMHYISLNIFSLAERHLRACIMAKPEEPVFYNNIALVLLKTGKPEEALECAKKANEMLPYSPEVKDTLRTVEKAQMKQESEAPSADDVKNESATSETGEMRSAE